MSFPRCLESVAGPAATQWLEEGGERETCEGSAMVLTRECEQKEEEEEEEEEKEEEEEENREKGKRRKTKGREG